MKNILILGDGLLAENFIERINQKRVGENSYTVVAPREFSLPEKFVGDITHIAIDPTSFSKLRSVFFDGDFSLVFISLGSPEESTEALKNIRAYDRKIRIYLVDHWDALSEYGEGSTRVININFLMSNRLFDELPNVPVVAQNVGLREGEIMEVLVSFGSSFAYRHVGSIPQIKWKIAALYRAGKLILPTNATMIRPQDTLLIVGRPQVLNSIYLRIHNKEGRFPEPFGKNLYLILDMCRDSERAINYLQEALYLRERLDDRQLYVRVINPGNFAILGKIKSYESHRVEVMVHYETCEVLPVIEADMEKCSIGLIFSSMDTFIHNGVAKELYDLKKLIYLFGDTPLYNLNRSVVLMSDDEEMESISSTSFYISEALGLDFCLCNFDPEGDFESKQMIIEHYETLSHSIGYPITIEEERANPVRTLVEMENILQIAPFQRELQRGFLRSIFSTKMNDHLLGNAKHPKLLVPIVLD